MEVNKYFNFPKIHNVIETQNLKTNFLSFFSNILNNFLNHPFLILKQLIYSKIMFNQLLKIKNFNKLLNKSVQPY